jgi:hypothetical protein
LSIASLRSLTKARTNEWEHFAVNFSTTLSSKLTRHKEEPFKGEAEACLQQNGGFSEIQDTHILSANVDMPTFRFGDEMEAGDYTDMRA